MGAIDQEFKTDRGQLLAALEVVLPAHCLLSGEEDLRAYECDGLTALRALPLAVCLPETENQVRDVLRVEGAPVDPDDLMRKGESGLFQAHYATAVVPQPGTRPRVLVVDDEPAIRKILRQHNVC